MLKSLLLAAGLSLGLASAFPALADVSLSEGVNYNVVGLEPSTKPKVIEFFNYGCPHCFATEPLIKAWLEVKPADVEFVRIPVNFEKPGWPQYALAYYVAEDLKMLDKTHDALFKRIHEEHKYFENDDDLVKFFVEEGADEAAVHKAMKSFAVKSKVNYAKAMLKKYQIMSVPGFIVNDMYFTDGSMLKGNSLSDVLTTLAHKK